MFSKLIGIWIAIEFTFWREKNHKTIYDELDNIDDATGGWFEVYKNCLVYIK